MIKWITTVTVLLFTGVHAGLQVVTAQAPLEQNQAQEFDADYVATNSQGRYYRAADGSSRQETVTGDRTRQFIFIVNMARREQYVYTGKDDTWRVRPVVYPDGYEPPVPLKSPFFELNNLRHRPQGRDLFIPPTDAKLIRIETPLLLQRRVYRQ